MKIHFAHNPREMNGWKKKETQVEWKNLNKCYKQKQTHNK